MAMSAAWRRGENINGVSSSENENEGVMWRGEMAGVRK
jgi:hypothetical protein